MTTASQALALGLCAYPAAGHTDREKPKRPFGKWEVYQTQRSTPHQLVALYTSHKFTTVGLICGAISGGLEVLDFDTVEGYQRFREAVKGSGLASVFERIGQGYAERTPRGMHLLYFCEEIAGNKKLNEKLKIETRGEGGYVVIAPSNLSEGEEVKQYRLTSGGLDSIARITPGERRALHALIGGLACESKVPEMVNIEFAPGAVIRKGGRNDALTSLAGSMRNRGMSNEALVAALHAENKARCDPPLPDTEVQTIVRSIIKYPAVQYQHVSAPATWQTPHELPSGIPAVPQFDPEQLLPPVLGVWVKDTAHRLQCPPDYPAIGIIVALSSVIGGRIQIRPKERDNWAVTPNLWGMVIGRPSTLKSPAIAAALAPLEALQKEAMEIYQSALSQYEAQHMAHELMLGNAKKQQSGAKGAKLTTSQVVASMSAILQDQPAKPTRVRYTVNDATVEKLGEILAENPNGVLLFRDELKGFLADLDGEDNATRRAFIMQAWEGNGSFDFDRIGRGHIHIPRTILSVLGTTQPGVIESYLACTLKGGVGDDGLMQRFQLAVYPDDPASPMLVDAHPDLQAAKNVSNLFKKLAQLDQASIGAKQDNLEGMWYVHFSTEAQQLFNDWYPKLMKASRGSGHAALESHFGKYRSLVPSLALIFHLAAGHTGSVGTQALNLAILFAAYLKLHAQRIYTYSIRGDALAARALGEAIKAGKLQDGFSLRDVQRKNWSGLSTHERCSQAIEILAECHWLAVVNSTSNGKTTARCYINPAVIEK